MEVHLTPDLEAKLNQLSAETGRAKEELVQDAMAGYLAELSQVRDMLDARYDDIKSGNALLWNLTNLSSLRGEEEKHLNSWKLTGSF